MSLGKEQEEFRKAISHLERSKVRMVEKMFGVSSTA